MEALKDKEGVVRAHAAGALGKIGVDSIEPILLEMLMDEDKMVREYVAEALGRVGKGETVKILVSVYENDNVHDVRAMAYTSILKILNRIAEPPKPEILTGAQAHISGPWDDALVN